MTSNQSSNPIDISILKKFVPLNDLADKQLKDLSFHSRIIKVNPKSLIFKRSINLKERFYLLAGDIDLCDSHFKIKKISANSEENYKMPLNSSNPTSTAAISTSTATLLLVDSDQLDLVLTWSQAGDYVVEDLHDNEDDTQGDWMSDLLQSNLLRQIPSSNIQQLFLAFKQDNYRKGQHIIRQGDQGDFFYVIESGSAQVYRTDDNGNEIDLATLTSGKFFGEEALISDNLRNASVKMLTEGSCMKLDKETFNKLLKEPVLKVLTHKKVQAMQMENPKIRIVDLRTIEESMSEPLENVMHIPFTELRQRLETLDHNLTYITHQIAGRRAELGAYLLSDAGLDAYVMKQ